MPTVEIEARLSSTGYDDRGWMSLSFIDVKERAEFCRRLERLNEGMPTVTITVTFPSAVATGQKAAEALEGLPAELWENVT